MASKTILLSPRSSHCQGRSPNIQHRNFRSAHEEKKSKETQAGQSKRFIETARKLGVDESEAGHEKAFGKVGLKKPKKRLAKQRRQ